MLTGYNEPEEGDAARGYEYLLHGNLFGTGIPYSLYKFLFKTTDHKALSLGGFNKHVVNDFMVFENGQTLATPGCFHCHAELFDGKMIIGLGNSYSKFQVNYSQFLNPAKTLLKTLYGKESKGWKDFEMFYDAGKVVSPGIVLETQGPNPAHRIAHLMAERRDPVTFVFNPDSSYFPLSAAAVPTDIPALWLTTKKNAWTYTGMARGNAAKHLMISTILTLKDTADAARIYGMMKDVWAYLKTLRPPAYPYQIDQSLAAEGKQVFNNNCSGCHGKYGNENYYPDKLIPEKIIGTDSLLLKYYNVNKGYEEWYNKSWYATAYQPAHTITEYGYVAPPLDGVWITAPYLHNGSVPTIEAVLDSKIRPRYWKRNFNKQQYDYKKLGWKYRLLENPGGNKTYNTDVPGYGNYGHYFGDSLTPHERRTVIEYLKTL